MVTAVDLFQKRILMFHNGQTTVRKMQQETLKIIDSYVPSSKPLTKEQENVVIDILRHRNNYLEQIYKEYMLKNNSPLTEEHKNIIYNFGEYLKNKNINPKVMRILKKIKTEGELKVFIMSFNSIISRFERFHSICDEAIINRKGKGFPLEYEQLIFQKRRTIHDCTLELLKMITKPSENPIVCKIESILKNKFGVETALLNDDITVAKRILKSVKKLKENNIPIPKRYIVSDYIVGGRCIPNGAEPTIILSSARKKPDILKIFKSIKEEFKKPDNDWIKKENILISKWEKQYGWKQNSSTAAEEHIETHEAIHTTHPSTFAFEFQKIPNIFSKTIKKISAYATQKDFSSAEIYAELKTKSLYCKLEPDEQLLLERYEGRSRKKLL